MTFCHPDLKSEFLTESLIETVNDMWYVDSVESGHDSFAKAFIFPGRKYLAVKICDVTSKTEEYNGRNGGRIWMFVDKKTGDVYKPASLKAPAKGVRFQIEELVNSPEMCDRYGSFLYVR